MKANSTDVLGLAAVEFVPTNDPKVAALQLIDTQKRSFAAAMDANGITVVIGKLLDAAIHPIFCAATQMASETPAQCHIDGTRLELKSGRSPTETALTVTIGCVQMIVFLPLAEVLRATADLVEKIEETPPAQKPH